MAYDLVKQTHPGAPCAIGLWVIEIATGRRGRIQQPVPGCRGVRVKFEGQLPIQDCPPDGLAYAEPAPAAVPSQIWCAQ